MNETTVKCQICGEPYVCYPFYAGDQSACQKCRDKARQGKNDDISISDIMQNLDRS